MRNLFTSYKEKKRAKAKREELMDFAKKSKVIEVFVKKGLLSYHPLNKRLFISLTLASVYLDKPERWTAFLQNIQQWAIYSRQRDAWEKFFLQEEVKAVRAAKKKYPVLTTSEIQRIRQEARMKIDITAIPAPKVENFEFFIADIDQQTDESKIIVIGKYEDGQIEMAEYDKVKRFLEQ